MSIDAAFTHFPSLTTNRLHLRQIQATDAKALFAIKSDQKVTEFYGQEPHQSLENTHRLRKVMTLANVTDPAPPAHARPA